METYPIRPTSYAFIFKPTIDAKNLNVGDNVSIGWENGLYCIEDILDPDVCFGFQKIEIEARKIDSLIEFVEHKLDQDLVIWDNKFVPGVNYATVVAVTNDYIIAIPEPSAQDRLNMDMIHTDNEIVNPDTLMQMILDSLDNCLMSEEKVIPEEKEETNMFSGLGSSFGKVYGDQFRLSINGLAVRGKDGKYYTFNAETRELVEVSTGFFDEMKDLLFIMPATELEVGDVVLHQNKPYHITTVDDNVVKGIDFEEAIESTLVPKTNAFGIKYFTKVFNCLGTNNILGSDIASNPMMAYALMGGKDFDLSKLMLFQAMGQGKNVTDFSENPVMLMALLGKENGGELGDFAKMQILSQMNNNNKKKETKKTTSQKEN